MCRFILHVIDITRSFNQTLSDARRIVYSIPQEDIPDNTYKIKFEIVNAAGSINTTTYDLSKIEHVCISYTCVGTCMCDNVYVGSIYIIIYNVHTVSMYMYMYVCTCICMPFLLETFDVQKATVKSVDSGILVTGELISNSPAMGCFVVVQCDERNLDLYQVLLQNRGESTVSATINVPYMDEVSHIVNVYDLEKDGLPNSMPAVEVDGISVPPHGKDGIYLYICWKFGPAHA